MSKTDEDTSATDDMGSPDPHGVPGAKRLTESNPAAVAIAGGEAVPVSNREETRERTKQALRDAKHARPIKPQRPP